MSAYSLLFKLSYCATLRTTPSGRKVCGTEKKRKKNNPKNSGHYVPLQRPKAAQALRSDQNVADD
jgi:hypothetical protein